jgi:hypothetical protein
MIARILNIARKELLHLRKDRVLIPFFIIGALAELTIIAWATSQPVDDLNLAVVDHDQSTQSAALVEALDETDTLDQSQECGGQECINEQRKTTRLSMLIAQRRASSFRPITARKSRRANAQACNCC